MCGDITQARLFRNKVNRAGVRLRKEFYQAKVTTLSESPTHEWWRHMKSLMGYTSNNLKSQVVSLQTAHSWANAGVLLGDACIGSGVAFEAI